MLFHIKHKHNLTVYILLISLIFSFISYYQTVQIKDDIIKLNIQSLELDNKYKNYKQTELIQIILVVISIIVYYEYVFKN
jgi:hypothetical protein